jgi:hypothetical protein
VKAERRFVTADLIDTADLNETANLSECGAFD